MKFYTKLKNAGLVGLFLCITIASTQAETYLNKWEKITSNKDNLNLYIDFDSFKYSDNKVYYVAKYHDLIKQRQNVVYIVSNCEDNKAAMLHSEKYNSQKKYTINNVNSYNPIFKTVKPDAAVFELHNIACVFKKNANTINEEVNFGPYMRELQRRIKMNWEPPKGSESRYVVVLMKIAKDGHLISTKILKSSNHLGADKAAMRAVEVTAPFRPLPQGYNKESIDVQFTFDYKVFGNNRY